MHLAGRLTTREIEEAPCHLIREITMKEREEILILLGKRISPEGTRGTTHIPSREGLEERVGILLPHL